MYQLYFSPGAASFSVHLALLEMNAPHELVRVDLQAGQQRSSEYLRLNPNGVVPTLVVDGQPMTESAALLLWLAEREQKLAPTVGSHERQPYLQWMLYLANTLQPAFRNWFYPHEAAGEANAEATKAVAQSKIEVVFDRLADHLAVKGPYLCGDTLTVADLHAFMLMRWSRNMPKPATSWPVLAEFVARIKARPTFKTLYEREGLTEWA
ncbi:glutathione S-transferase [Ahniella affigens]|uniref:Glutathione S-transferase n=1 Tax=Ahniella affigens TaxID=2021234 RepID=A0A2P1PXG1_9GAMM|nr:glutathione S-transferase family protein [Ahniella affigens]AVP99494.1 glutathione S-transferase [Ahniella affigens]